MYKNVKRKLKSTNGASIIISLMFLLVVMMVGAVCLVAARNNAGRATHAKKDLQEYYAVESAIMLIQQDLSKAKFQLTPVYSGGEITEYTVEYRGETTSDGTPRYGKIVYDLLAGLDHKANYKPADRQGNESELTIIPTDDTFTKDLSVSGSLTIGKDSFDATKKLDPDFMINIGLWNNNAGKTYATKLIFPAMVRDISIYNTDETVTQKLEISWGEPQVGKEAVK